LFCGSVSDTLFLKFENTRHQKDATLSFIRAGNGVRNLNCKNIKNADQNSPVVGMWVRFASGTSFVAHRHSYVYKLSLII
jgi:hypothetical protein